MIKHTNSIALIFASIVLAAGLSAIFDYPIIVFIVSSLSLALLVVASYFDIKDQEVDVKIFIALVITSGLFNFLISKDLVNLLISVAGAAAIPTVFALVSKEKLMGWGDVFFLAACGAYLGVKLFYWGVVGTFLLAGLFGIILVVTRVGSLKSRIPLGPFVLLALLAVKLISINFNYVFPF